jgi:8-oxo-dGTP diphosphatase
MKKYLLKIWLYMPGWVQRLAAAIVVPRYQVVAAALIFNGQGQLLLCKHTYRRPDPWGLPGGSLKFGENPNEAVRRELMEETGLAVDEIRLVLMEGSHEVRKLILTYLCSGARGSFVPNEEVSEVRYFDTEALPQFRSEEAATVKKALAILAKPDKLEGAE